MVLILPNFVNFDRPGENQYLRNFGFYGSIAKEIPAKKLFRIHLGKSIIIEELIKTTQSSKFIFTGFWYWIFSNNKNHGVCLLKYINVKFKKAPCFSFQIIS